MSSRSIAVGVSLIVLVVAVIAGVVAVRSRANQRRLFGVLSVLLVVVSVAGLLWSSPHNLAAPVPAGLMLFTSQPGADDTVIARRASDGSEQWRKDTGTPVACASGMVLTMTPVSAHPGESIPRATLNALRPGDGSTLWSIPYYGGLPVVSAGTIYTLLQNPPTAPGSFNLDGELDVMALRTSDGSVRWQIPAGTMRSVTSPLVVSNGLVFYLSTSDLVALRADTGQFAWHLPLTQYPGSDKLKLEVAAGDDMVYLVPGIEQPTGRTLMALRATDGTILWRFTDHGAGIGVVSYLVEADGLVYFAASTNPYEVRVSLYAVRASDGGLVWRLPLEGATPGSRPVVADGVVYLSAEPGQPEGWLYAVRAADGKQIWRASAGGNSILGTKNAFDSPIVMDDTVFVTNHFATRSKWFRPPGPTIVALRASDGTRYWSVDGVLGCAAET